MNEGKGMIFSERRCVLAGGGGLRLLLKCMRTWIHNSLVVDSSPKRPISKSSRAIRPGRMASDSRGIMEISG